MQKSLASSTLPLTIWRTRLLAGVFIAFSALGSSVAYGAPEIGDVSITPIGPTSGRTILVSALHPDVTGLLVSGSPGCAGGVFRPASQPIEYTLPNANDWNSIYTRTTTDMGEGSDCLENRVLHDDQNPVVFFTVQPSQFTAIGSAAFEFTVTDGETGSHLGTLSCQLNAQGWQACESPTQLSGLPEGEHSFEVEAVDQAGNRSAIIGSSWIVDLTAPFVSIAGPPDVNGIVRFSADDGAVGSGVESYYCAVDSKPREVCSSPFSVGSLAPGPHSLTVTAVDMVGHESQSARVEWVTVLPKPLFDVKIRGITGKHDSIVDAFFLGRNHPWLTLETSGTIDSLEAQVISSTGKVVCSRSESRPTDLVRFEKKCHLNEGESYVAKVVAKSGKDQIGSSFGFTVDTRKPKVSVTRTSIDPSTGDLVVTFEIVDSSPIVSARCVLFAKKKGRIEYDCTGRNEVRFSGVAPEAARVLVIRATDSVGRRGGVIQRAWHSH